MIGLIERSVSAAELLVLIMIIRALLLHRLPKITFQILWAVAILRLLLPYSFEVPAGIPRLFSAHQALSETEARDAALPGHNTPSESMKAQEGRAASQSIALQDEEIPSENNAATEGTKTLRSSESNVLSAQQGLDTAGTGNTAAAKNMLTDVSRKTALAVQKVKEWLTENRFALRGIWFTGAILCLLYFTVSHLCCRRLYAQAVPADVSVLPVIPGRRVRIRVSDRISAPFTYGILRPVILLPKITDWNNTSQLRMILEHESVHIRRLDVLYKWIMTAALCAHWFNPFVWVMYALACRDMELSCDEAVVKRFENGNRADYALALLNYEEKRSLSPMFTRFSGNAVKERIEAIMKLNKTSLLSAALAAVLVAGATSVFAAPRETADTPLSLDENTQAKADAQYPEEAADNPTGVKQYLCEPSYYTAEEFKAVMQQECRSIENEVAAGTLTREAADEMLEQIRETIEDVQDGRKIQAPSPVFYSDGTPVVNSKGEQLYAKASDIEEMNEALRAKAASDYSAEVTAVETAADDTFWSDELLEDVLLYGDVLYGDADGICETAATELLWYTYEEYQEYAEQQKKEYAAMLGAWGFDTTDGWYEWTEEVIEKACAQLDETLKFIKDGGMLSKPFEDTDGTTVISSMPGTARSSENTAIFSQAYEIDSISEAPKEENTAAIQEGGEWDEGLLQAYEPYGITADKKTQYYLFNGRPIAGFVDKGFMLLTDGQAAENEGIYVMAVRDGSRIQRLVEISKEEFSELSGLNLQ